MENVNRAKNTHFNIFSIKLTIIEKKRAKYFLKNV